MFLSAGNIFIIVAPSGAGKSSLVDALRQADSSLDLSISCTTRQPRPGEIEGRHYRYISTDEFYRLRDQGNMLEWAQVHGNYYGTPRDSIQQAVNAGRDIILEIDWQGARQVRKHYPNAIGIFILPPSIDALQSRLEKRGQDQPAVIAKRLRAAGEEMSHVSECEYVIINQEFNLALSDLQHIINAARLRYATQTVRHALLFSQLGIRQPTSN